MPATMAGTASSMLNSREPADGHAGAVAARRGAFAAVAVTLHARQACERFRDVRIGQLADVVGSDGVDDFHRVLLDRQGRFRAGAEAFHDDGVGVGRRHLCHRLRREGLGQCQCDEGHAGADMMFLVHLLLLQVIRNGLVVLLFRW
jgi:hypothetical protein